MFLVAEYLKSQLGKPASKSVDGCYTRVLIRERNPPLRQSLFSFHCLHKAAFILKRFAAHMGEKDKQKYAYTHTYIHSYTLTLFVKPFQKNTCGNVTGTTVLLKEEGYKLEPIKSINFCSRSIELQIPENTVKYTVVCHAAQVSWSA